jgi:hypothetical protein
MIKSLNIARQKMLPNYKSLMTFFLRNSRSAAPIWYFLRDINEVSNRNPSHGRLAYALQS